MPSPIQLPPIPEAERTPLVEQLSALIEHLAQENRRQAETIQQLRDEIAVLKGEKAKPKFKPSGMEEETDPDPKNPSGGDPGGEPSNPRPGSNKRRKTPQLMIHQDIPVRPPLPLPPGSRFKGYRDFVVQDLKIEPHNIRYRLEVWQTPEGQWLCGELPKSLHGSHFGPGLRTFVLYQYHHCHVTQPLLHEQLREWGIDLSVGQIDALLSGHNEAFFVEKDQLLVTGLEVSRSITVDDSGARHQGQNGYVTHIGNEWFAWFSSTSSKNRINFLQLLHAGSIRYGLNEHALDYWVEQGLPQEPRQRLQAHWPAEMVPACWERHLDALGIDSERHRRLATEGALLGGLIDKGFSLDLVIVSDGAGQFAILLHALCWVHAERLVHKLIPLNDRHRQDQARVRGEIWQLYADLKAYQRALDPARAPELEARFEAIFTQRTSFETLNQTLKRLRAHQDKLLLVLKRPDIPLHTNGSENDIRGYVKWRKISGGTRSDLGKRCRDTFASLKKTCRKLGISFWEYLTDRIEQHGEIPPLPDIVRQRALGMP
jgi:transposase IS66 family protein